MKQIRNWLKKLGISRANLRWFQFKKFYSNWFMAPCFSNEQRKKLFLSSDPVRYGTILLALEEIKKNNIPGSLAECGVFRGDLSKFIHQTIPDKLLYLFDTFHGFDSRDSDSVSDHRFRDTSVEMVLNNIGNSKQIKIKEGFFPETTNGIENEHFAFVMIDFDKYESTLAALEFFYPRTNKNGFIFVHDYNSSESNWACFRALNKFLEDKPEKPISIPDAWGTALFRKLS